MEVKVKISDFTPSSHKIFAKACGKTPLIVEYSIEYKVNFDIPMVTLKIVEDPTADDKGSLELYSYSQDSTFNNQMDIRKVELVQIRTMLRMIITMENITDIWSPTNGFNHITFQIYFDDPNKVGAVDFPFQNATMPENYDWDYGMWATSWGIYLYNLNNARSSNFGDPITPSPVAEVNKQENKITFLIPLSVLETNDLTG